MQRGDKVIITQNGMTKRQAQAKGVVENAHPKTREYWENCLTFEAGMEGIITDLNASGDKWKVKVGKNIYYVPVESVK